VVREAVDGAPIWGKTRTGGDSLRKRGFGQLGGGRGRQEAEAFYRHAGNGGKARIGQDGWGACEHGHRGGGQPVCAELQAGSASEWVSTGSSLKSNMGQGGLVLLRLIEAEAGAAPQWQPTAEHDLVGRAAAATRGHMGEGSAVQKVAPEQQ
jgi:hypothetical protein